MKLPRLRPRYVILLGALLLVVSALGVVALQAARLRELERTVLGSGGNVLWTPLYPRWPEWFGNFEPVPYLQSLSRVEFVRDPCTSVELRQVAGAIERCSGATESLTTLILLNSPVDGSAFATLPELPVLRLLELSGCELDGTVTAEFDRLPALHSLYLGESSVNDADLEALPRLDHLDSLYLYRTRVEGAGLAHLSRHPRLKFLDLSGTTVDNDGIAALTGASSLEELILDGTQIDDGAVDHLLRLPRLTSLSASNTQLSDEGVRRLSEKFPGLEVWDD